MAEYIEREALLCMVRPDDPSDEKAAITIATAKKLIRSLAYRCPASDVAQVRHGRWKQARYTEAPLYICSECYKPEYKQHKFCPECGAKMDLEATHE